ncbi:GNAT superfamily N-acetyltransferase [Actinoplanes tereljensis]|uniref:GNAT family N-acetyltransferase n=1 Tax=Paractinoplanes tereljensis TaxID=571912 RepID=A0A919NUG9_9ACTN|nr:GNAT family N-acetyltransferase [Actinoplanes tereljensis]GIF25486.1 GNAT family N-acetyltransferase [Actinoplanes tereljensis]
MIAIAAPSLASDVALVATVTDLVNEVYAVAEEGLWAGPTDRTDGTEIAKIIAAGELVVAREGGQIIGVARVCRLPADESVGEAGMLVADPKRRGAGIGRDLLAYAEGWAVDLGLKSMQVELLVPREWTHPVKQFLREWYTRAGYRVVRVTDLAEDYPALAPHLACPCDFLIFNKPL